MLKIFKKILKKFNKKKYCIVRSKTAGVFAGYIEKKYGQTIIMKKARRLWYWDGAASLSQLAIDGVSKPENCRFPQAVKRIEIFEVVEIIYATEKCRRSINNVPIWKIE